MKTETRSPIKDRPLRNPGQSLQSQRVDLLFDKLLAPFLIVLMAVVWAVLEWIRYLHPTKPQPFIFTAIAIVALIHMFFQYRKYWPQIQTLILAEDGEKAVGQFLESLRGGGYKVFHDVIGKDFNVDHVVIGSAGIFTIETKTRSKPMRGRAIINFDGEQILVGGFAPDRDPVIQAKAQASWIKQLLSGSTGKAFPVRPVVVFPGWYIETVAGSSREVWVLEPKALPAFLYNAPNVLAPEDVSLAAYHLSRFVREQEKLLEAAK
ncbi:MAG: nuclease-related domain-containing protein [Georgfuchsia sp.]